MRHRLVFIAALIGLLLGLGAVWFFSRKHPPQPPFFTPAENPYAQGIYANGIIESYQGSGENVAIFAEVGGPIVSIPATEGQIVHKGDPLAVIDPSVQQKTVAQQKAQAEAARTLLAELRAQPRPETLEVARAQMDSAAATLRQLNDTMGKLRRSADMDPRSVSKETLDTAVNAAHVGEANLEVAKRQYELTRAGAWGYDIQNQEKLAASLQAQYEASSALLQKYTLRAPIDGAVLSINAAVGGYVSPQGTYDSYTQGLQPVVVMSGSQGDLGVRVYVDEILVHRLPPAETIVAKMQIRGTDVNLPLQFVRLQPYVTPKIELSAQRSERVDLRVLPVLFRFQAPKGLKLYPGQLVDVYIGSREK